jgi:hypothetical protein
MWKQVCLSFRSYIPKRIEVGMMFLSSVNGMPFVFILERTPINDEEFLKEVGYPVEPYIVDIGENPEDDVEVVLAEPHQIAWWDAGEDVEDLVDIEVEEFNDILQQDNGWLEIEMDSDDQPNIFMGKVTLRPLAGEYF